MMRITNVLLNFSFNSQSKRFVIKKKASIKLFIKKFYTFPIQPYTGCEALRRKLLIANGHGALPNSSKKF